MKRIVFYVMILAVVVATACNNQNKSGSNEGQREGRGNFNSEEFVNRQMEEMTELLDLSGKQEKQVREIMLAGFDEMAAMRDEMRNGGGDREAMREKMMQMREKQNDKMKEVLSEEQWEKYDTYQKERRGRRGQGRLQ